MQEDNQLTDEYDREFIALITDIRQRYIKFQKHDKLRIESWLKKLCQVTNNLEWKKNRNLHAILLLDMILNKRFEEPYTKFAPDSPIPVLSKTLVKSRLSKKFWKSTQKLYDEINKEDNIENYDINNLEVNNDNYNDIKKNENVEKIEIDDNYKEYKLKSVKKNSNISDFEINQKLNDEIIKMKKVISNLENQLKKKDIIIQNQNNDKIKIIKKIEELEGMLSQFLSMEKNS